MKIDIVPLTHKDGVTITLENKLGFKIQLTNFGAALLSIDAPDRDGRFENVILKYENIDDFYYSDQYFGKTVGRTAGRIANSILKINHETYALDSENGPHILHGGRHSFAYKMFKFKLVEYGPITKVSFSYISPFGEGGYPGQVNLLVNYTFYEDQHRFDIDYEAKVDFPTLLNLTNHAYFNLSGHRQRDILEQHLTMNTPYFYDIDQHLILQNKLKVTPIMDFQQGKPIGQHLQADYLQLSKAYGYDHTFETNGEPFKALLFDPISGRRLTINSSYQAVNIYTDNYPSHKKLSHHQIDTRYSGIAIEPEFVPINFDSYTIYPEQPYHQTITYTFDVIKSS